MGSEAKLPPVRTITRGPKFHWFGYYDKFEFDPTNRYVLGMEVDFEHRSPTPQDSINIGMVDLHDGDRWIELGKSAAWCWQQGCMLQWVPDSQSEILWNDRDGDHFCCHILDIRSGKRRTIPHPIYALSPDGKTGLSLDFSRLNDVRPGYGYAGVPDPYADQSAPARARAFFASICKRAARINHLSSGHCRPRARKATMEGASISSTICCLARTVRDLYFLHRWTGPKGRETRMYTATPDGKDLRLIDDNGLTSHFMWRDSRHILALSNQRTHGIRFYVFEDGGNRTIEVVGEEAMTSDGHCYLPAEC